MENGLVKGYTIQNYATSSEQLFFVDGDKAFEGVEQPIAAEFRTSAWAESKKPLNWVRENAEFIGSYVRPSNFA